MDVGVRSAHNAMLFGIDVHAIQKYLFATSKLREIVGASQVVSDFSSAWVTEALESLGLRDESRTLSGPSSTGYVPVRIGGGSVRILLPSTEAASALAREMNCRAVERAPGLVYDIGWVPFDADSDGLAQRNGDLIDLLSDRRNRPRRGGSFGGFPFAAPCRLTLDPAAGYGQDANERLCEASLFKRLAQSEGGGDWLDHVRDLEVVRSCGDPGTPFEFELSCIAGDDRDNAYVAVLCVDLNELGERGRLAVDDAKGRVAASLFHAFTEKVKDATIQSFRAALSSLPLDPAAKRPMEESRRPKRRLPVRPLVIGGDDLVFVMHAACGIPFALAMLETFWQHGFAGAAGVAFVKAKSPFGRAMDLAEQLVASAKAGGRAESRIDFAFCSGEIPGELDAARSQLSKPDRRLAAGPWTVDGFRNLVNRARALADLPRSHVRRASDRCCVGMKEGERAFDDLLENLARGLGGRPGRRLPSVEDLRRLYPTGFFEAQADGVRSTDLLDCIDLFRFVVGDMANRDVAEGVVRERAR